VAPIVAKPNGLTVHFDHANGGLVYRSNTSLFNGRGQSDGIITFPGKGLRIPPNCDAAVLFIAYRARSEVGDPTVAETQIGQFVRGSVHGGPIEPQRLVGPDGKIISINSDGSIGDVTSLARFDATLTPPATLPYQP
jgi:hypothetical protein